MFETADLFNLKKEGKKKEEEERPSRCAGACSSAQGVMVSRRLHWGTSVWCIQEVACL